MLTFLSVFAIVFLILLVFIIIEKTNILNSIIISFIISIVASLTIGTIIALIIQPKTKIVSEKFYLESLNDGQETYGKFFLGSGKINNQMMYYYYYEDDGYYNFGQMFCNDAKIKYNDNEKPYLEIQHHKNTEDLINKFSINCKNPTYIFHIPPGSIKSNFILDLE